MEKGIEIVRQEVSCTRMHRRADEITLRFEKEAEVNTRALYSIRLRIQNQNKKFADAGGEGVQQWRGRLGKAARVLYPTPSFKWPTYLNP